MSSEARSFDQPEAVGMETIVTPFERAVGGVFVDDKEGGIDDVAPSEALAMIKRMC